jgi:hypothetical protein
MSVLLPRWLAWVGLSVTLVWLAVKPEQVWSSAAWAGGVQEPPVEDLPEGLEVRAKGPVHEAYATPAQDSRPTPIVPQQPPEPIEELPPDQKPDGENVVWIPGYWHWDEDEEQFLWVSGFWRVVPPGRVWVPGWWRSVEGGWQWVPGFWQTTVSEERPGGTVTSAAEVEYLPEPPASLEVGPSIPAPTATSFYVPGHWVWRGRYIWRPGFWWEYRPGWVWVPAHYRWTPLGWVFVPGYWDYPLAARGVLFAPVLIRPILWRRPAFVYTPVYVISEPALFGCLFVRRGWGCYFFGDYFGPRYIEAGFSAWCGRFGPRGGFAIGFGVGRSWGYDPLWSYYSLAYQDQPAWINGLNTLYLGRWRGDIPRPPVNLVQQNTIINNISQTNIRNVTNNITVVNRSLVVNKTDVTSVAMVAPLKAAAQLQPEVGLRPLSAEARKREAQQVRQFRELASQRAKWEAAKQPSPGKATQPIPPAARSVKLELPADIARPALRQPVQKQPPPPPGAARPNPSSDSKGEPKGKGKIDPKVDPKGKIDPKVDPKGKVIPPLEPKGKGDPKTDPMDTVFPKGKVEPKGKIDAKGKVVLPEEPKLDPKNKVFPKIDPKGKVDPKGVPLPPVDPKGKVDPKSNRLPPVDPKGKVDPKGVPLLPVNPKVDPKGIPPPPIDPKDKVFPKGKVDPKGIPPPPIDPKVDPKSNRLPPVDPKGVSLPPVGGSPPPFSRRPTPGSGDMGRRSAPNPDSPISRGSAHPVGPQKGPLIAGTSSTGLPPRSQPQTSNVSGNSALSRLVNGTPLPMGKSSGGSVQLTPMRPGPIARTPAPPVSPPARPDESTSPGTRRSPRRR